VRGHTHTPSYKERAVPVLNPGSLTRPRGSPPSYAWLTCEDGRYGGRIVTLDSEILVGFGEEL
jgi:predicted phosphodiesterase